MINSDLRGQKEYKVQALERALDILDCFTFQTREQSLSEIAKKTGLNKTTAKRLMSNLTKRGYLQHDAGSRNYQLGMRLFELGGVVFSSFSLRRAAARPMDNLLNDTGSTVLLGVMREEQLVYLDKREGRGMIRISSEIGWHRPIHYGMLGMVLLAYLDLQDARALLRKYPLQKHTSHSITDEKAFFLRLEQIQRDGHAVERHEAVEGLIGISGPIRDYSRKVVAALGIALMAREVQKKSEMDRFIGLVKEACAETSAALGHLKNREEYAMTDDVRRRRYASRLET
ncbi:MAG: IclR family transcriptional regulator [Desulfobacteraceae bacterium]|nr:MAG: IclR family transcriptional regulator [Desulfobacteraceae bacterium]